MAFIVLDTETAPTIEHKDGKAHPETSRVYDLGYVVCDADGSILVERSFIVADTFFDERLMKSAYYANKLPQYHNGIGRAWIPVSFLAAWKQFKDDIKAFNVKTVWAYNARFDETALNASIKAYSNGFASFFVPYGVKVKDVWDFASCITGTRKFAQWAFDQGFTTAAGNPSTSAETVYRYLTNDNEFIEDHTALSDAKIELAILLAAKRRKSKTRHSKGQGWRDAAKITKTLAK